MSQSKRISRSFDNVAEGTDMRFETSVLVLVHKFAERDSQPLSNLARISHWDFHGKRGQLSFFLPSKCELHLDEIVFFLRPATVEMQHQLTLQRRFVLLLMTTRNTTHHFSRFWTTFESGRKTGHTSNRRGEQYLKAIDAVARVV